jgi:hypothetical protein
MASTDGVLVTAMVGGLGVTSTVASSFAVATLSSLSTAVTVTTSCDRCAVRAGVGGDLSGEGAGPGGPDGEGSPTRSSQVVARIGRRSS